jgi:hypothetical protein
MNRTSSWSIKKLNSQLEGSSKEGRVRYPAKHGFQCALAAILIPHSLMSRPWAGRRVEIQYRPSTEALHIHKHRNGKKQNPPRYLVKNPKILDL